MYDKDKVDLETIVVDDVFKLLQCTDNGLDSEEAKRRLELFGPNKLESEEQNPFLQVSFSSIPLSALGSTRLVILSRHHVAPPVNPHTSSRLRPSV